MKRAIAFIDGFNFYHSLLHRDLEARHKWVDLWRVSQRFVPPSWSLERVYHFTAMPYWNADRRRRHQEYLEALRFNGVAVIEGRFSTTTRTVMTRSGKHVRGRAHEEKRSDVHLAVKILECAVRDWFDRALVFCADGDLAPAIETLADLFPRKEVDIIFPYKLKCAELGRCARACRIQGKFARVRRIEKRDLDACLMPEVLARADGTEIRMPVEYR